MDRGRIFSTLSSDAIGISISAGAIINAMSAVIMLVFVIAYIGVLSIPALVITCVFIAGAVFFYLQKSKTVESDMREATVRENEFFDNLNGLLSGFKEFKLNREKADDFFGEELFKLVSSTAALRLKAGKAMNQAVLIGQTFLFVTVGGVLFLLPNITPGDLGVVVPVMAVVLFAAGPIGDVVVAIPALEKAKASIGNIQRLEAEVDSMQSDVEVLAMEADVRPEPFQSLGLENVSFQYPKNGTRPFALQPFSFKLKRGVIVFVVGGNGSGKSTFLKLLTGLYAPAQGERYLNGAPVTDGTLGVYRDLFAPIFSDFYLSQRLLAAHKYDSGRVEQLLQRMELTGITELKDGRITNLKLSTGQKKRLALILACLDDKPVYIFDEWAADQDPVFRRFFYETLLREMKAEGKSVVAATHDDHYFHVADRVVKLEYGQFVSS
jgi:putative ATP-binding cassette transporter